MWAFRVCAVFFNKNLNKMQWKIQHKKQIFSSNALIKEKSIGWVTETDVSRIRNEYRCWIGRSIYSINLPEFQSAVGRIV